MDRTPTTSHHIDIRSTDRRRRHTLACALGLVTGGIAGSLALAAPAAVALPMLAVVTTPTDDLSEGSLRSVINSANLQGGDWTIRLTAGEIYTIDRQCAAGNLDDNHGGDLDITSDSTIRIEAMGPGGVAGEATIAVQCANERVIDHLGTGTPSSTTSASPAARPPRA